MKNRMERLKRIGEAILALPLICIAIVGLNSMSEKEYHELLDEVRHGS